MIESFILSFISNSYFKVLIITIFTALCMAISLHIIIYKKDSRSALGWLMLVISAPILGAIIYFIFGLNRIQRKAVKLDLGVKLNLNNNHYDGEFNEAIKSILKVGESLSFSPFCAIESIIPLNTGDEAYPQMLNAIKNAKKSISLYSYIFSVDPVGFEFIDALADAKKRGVQVCILVDGVGSQATLSELSSLMEELEIEFNVFLPVLWRPRYVNLRNHRKILVVDAVMAFTGGINIGETYWPFKSSIGKVLDFHFKFEGPIVNYIQAVFAEDWYYCSEKTLNGPLWFRPIENNTQGSTQFARVVVGGPGINNEKIQWHFINLINQAKNNIRIVSPYFLPSGAISTALIAASQRGVRVDIIIPCKSDHALIVWASQACLSDLLQYGCHIWYSPPPFDHSKLFIVDDNCLSVGSANWDVRSLRLNFEMNIEVYSSELAESLIQVFEAKKSISKIYTIHDYEKRSFFVKVRGGLARLASPYL